MSVGFNPKDSQVDQQSLRVQELVVSGADGGLFLIAGGNTTVMIREPVEKVFLARVKVDGSNTWTEFAQSSITIVDSVSNTTTPPSNKGGIKLTGLASLAANDVIVVRYSVLEHL